MLHAYFDESGTHTTAPLTAVGGFIADPIEWAQAEEEWKRVLRELEISQFHLTECENATGDFQKFGSRPEIRRYAARELAKIVKTHLQVGYVGVVDRDSWDEAASERLRTLYPNPYHVCFEYCLGAIDNWVCDFQKQENIGLIFSEQTEYMKDAYKIYNLYKKHKKDSNLVSLKFNKSKNSTALQAADAIVSSHNLQIRADIFANDTENRIYRVFLDEISDGLPVCECHFDTLAFYPISDRLEQFTATDRHLAVLEELGW